MITIVTAIDEVHFKELQVSLPTWIKYKQFDQYKFLIIYDADYFDESIVNHSLFKGLDVQFIPWFDPFKLYTSQREKMLTALTVVPGNTVKTDWYLKIDTDTIATNTEQWYDESWLAKDYVFISNPWSSTKPSNAISLLDKWIIENYKLNPLNLPFDPSSNKIIHSRIISWLFFCKTEWSKKISAYCFKPELNSYKLPSISDKQYKVSQDTYMWFMASVLGNKYKTFKFKSKGWDHIKIS